MCRECSTAALVICTDSSSAVAPLLNNNKQQLTRIELQGNVNNQSHDSGNCVEIFLTTPYFQYNFEKYSILKKKNQIQTMKRFCHLDNRNTLVNLHIYTSPVICTTFCILFQVSVWPLMKEI